MRALLCAVLLAAATWAATPSPAPALEFAVSLFRAASQSSRANLCIAPYSVSGCLQMTGEGADGATRSEFERVLGIPLGAENGERVAHLRQKLATQGVRTANRIWLQNGFPVEPAYQSFCETYFGAGVGQLDFQQQPEPARATINRWVEEATDHKISELLSTGALDANTRLVLTDAIYLKCLWAAPFDPAHTRPGEFRNEDGSTSQVSMMERESPFPYAKSEGVDVIELPYRTELSMVLAVPPAGQLSRLEDSLTAARLQGWLVELAAQAEEPSWEVKLGLPRFQVATNSFRMRPVLEKLGLALPFSTASDFGRMSPKGRLLSMSNLYHGTYLKVDEQGTEAAGASAAVVSVRGGPAHRTELRVDRPFLFWIVHQPTDCMLFAGRVTRL